MNAVIIEDEASLRTLIKNFVTEIDREINIVAQCDNIEDAESVIKDLNPDIVFLDIILPGGTAFDLLESLPNLQSEVIFITAYDKYVLDAFRYAAIGYILKPVDKAELKIAIQNAKKRIAGKSKNNNIDELLNFIKNKNATENTEKIGVPTQDGFIFLAPSDIVRCEGYNAYTKIFLKDTPHIISSYNLAQFKKILPEETFFQVHKSHIVALPQVYKYHSKEAILEMANGDNIPVSKKIKTEFISHFKIPRR